MTSKLTLKRPREVRKNGIVFVIYFEADENSQEVKCCVEKMFDENQNVKRIQVYQHAIIMRLFTPQRLQTVQKFYKDSNQMIQIAERNQFNVPNQECVFFKERSRNLICPAPNPNHITVFSDGKFCHKPAVGYVFGLMLNRMKFRSTKRNMTFDIVKTLEKLSQALNKITSDFDCGCERSHCNEKLQLFGLNAMSPDRKRDDLGYSDENQVITMVVKAHNTRFQPNSQPQEAKTQDKWTSILRGNMFQHTKNRIIKLQKLRIISNAQQLYIDRYREQEFQLKFEYRKLLESKRITQNDKCFRCGTEMYFGDQGGIFRETKNARKVSPDRVDDTNVFYDDSNFNLVCCSCNYNGQKLLTTYIETKPDNQEIALTHNLLQQCKDWLILKKIQVANEKKSK